MPALVGGGGAALMPLTALGGADYINNRNTIAVLAIVLAVPAIGYAAGSAGVWVGERPASCSWSRRSAR